MERKQNPEKVGSDSDSERESSNVSDLFPGTSSGFELMEDDLVDSAIDDYDILIIEHPVEGSSAYHGDVASTSAVSDAAQSENLPQRTSRSPSKRARPSHQPTSDESDDPRGEDPPSTMDDHHSAHRDTGMECNHHHGGGKQHQRRKSVSRHRKTSVPRADLEPPTRRSKKRGASESSDADVEDNTTSVPFVPLPTIQEVEEPPPPSTSQQKSKKSKSKCLVCKKKLGLTAIECRCGGVFCARHRYDSEHDCSFDYRAMGAEEIRRNNPLVIAEKVPKL